MLDAPVMRNDLLKDIDNFDEHKFVLSKNNLIELNRISLIEF